MILKRKVFSKSNKKEEDRDKKGVLDKLGDFSKIDDVKRAAKLSAISGLGTVVVGGAGGYMATRPSKLTEDKEVYSKLKKLAKDQKINIIEEEIPQGGGYLSKKIPK